MNTRTLGLVLLLALLISLASLCGGWKWGLPAGA